jgi:tetratricopeptide (TPR) repeat protein
MLFDLQGRRRRVVQVTYVGLALLMGGGLVLFGIGGGGAMQGGLVDAITGSSGGDTGAERFQQREEAALRATQTRPQDPKAWAELARVRVQAAGIGENFDPNTNGYTDSGRAKLESAAQAWNKYLELDPENPDDRVASLMIRAFDPTGLNRPADAVKAQEIVTEARPGATPFARLAIYAYQAGQTRKGDLARNEALERAPKDERNTLKDSLDQAKQQAVAQQLQQNQGSATPTPTPKQEK